MTECLEAIEKIKGILAWDLFITHYNPNLEIIVMSDTISYGIGACILQKKWKTDHRNQSLTHQGRCYPQKNDFQIA